MMKMKRERERAKDPRHDDQQLYYSKHSLLNLFREEKKSVASCSSAYEMSGETESDKS
jgi:hypothetical protein